METVEHANFIYMYVAFNSFTSKHELRLKLEHFHTLRWTRPRHGLRHLMRTSTEFINWISAPAISTSFDFHALVKWRFSDVYLFMSRHICTSLCAFLLRSLINCYTIAIDVS